MKISRRIKIQIAEKTLKQKPEIEALYKERIAAQKAKNFWISVSVTLAAALLFLYFFT